MTTKLTHEQRAVRRAEIAEFCKTHTVAEACAKFACSETHVTAACRTHGVAPKSAKLFDQSRLRLIAALVNTNTPFTKLAAKHRISKQAVEQLAARCADAGLKVKAR